MRSSLVAAALAVVVAGVPGLAGAEPTSEERALASVLFAEGRQLMSEGNSIEACPKLEESQRLDPGGGTLLNLALCHEAIGRTATAWAELLEARGVARRDDRQDRVELAQEHLDALQSKLLYLTVQVPPESEIPGLEILRDGRPLAKTAWGVRAPLDPGAHRIEARAPDFEPWFVDIDVTPSAEARDVLIPRLVPSPKAPPPIVVTPPVAAPSSLPHRTPVIPSSEAELGSLGYAGVTIGATGALALIGAVASTAVAASKRGESEAIDATCDPGCSQEAVDLNDDAKVAADAATGLVIIGGVLAAGGLTMLLVDIYVDEPAAPATARVELGPARARLTVSY